MYTRCRGCGRRRRTTLFIGSLCGYWIETGRKYRFDEDDFKNLRARAYAHKITVEQFLDMVEERHGKCDVCSDVLGLKLDIDHDHATQKIRGLLCRSCNTTLGYM